MCYSDFLCGRLILFAEVYWIHYLGVEHRDLKPQNVLQKRWSYLFKIIDFGFSDVDHTCPGWRKCGELKKMRCKLQLDMVDFRFRWMEIMRPIPGLDYLVLPFITLQLTWLVFVIISGTPANWRM